MTTPIPQPPAIPFLGNITNIDTELPARSFTLLAQQYGEIFRLNLLGKEVVFVSTVALAQEATDEKRFHKAIGTALVEVRNLVADGLFTSYHGEKNWGIAHRILMPAFGPLAIKGMFDDMFDVISQLVLKWERFGPLHTIDPTDDFTRLAFETIALCTFNYRLNTFYTMQEPPFVKAMGDFLYESFLRSRRPSIVQALSYSANAKYTADMDIMNQLADQIVDDRKKHPLEKKDLLNAMLLGKDPQTGEGLSEANVKAQMLTFLIAGHETTSGMLSFAMAHILKNPEVYAKVQQEVDSVLGKEPVRLEHLSKLTYINALLRESLRITPSISQFAVEPEKDEIIGNGKYLIKKGTTVVIMAGDIGRDPTVWGENAGKFDPDRMLDGKFEALPPKAWLPFGSGARACIGRAFAWQEALIAVATIFQKFDLTPADPSYTLQLKQTLTLKPKNFGFHAIPRKGAPSFSVAVASTQTTGAQPGKDVVGGGEGGKAVPMYVLYGSNTGSCEGFAQGLASEAAGKGFRATIGTLNSVAGNIPKDGPVVIITASFEGEPADNAGHFFEALTSSAGQADLSGVSYAVFGAGNRDWAQTYQRVPKLIDATLEKKGARKLLERGEADAGGDLFTQSFEEWEENLWKTLAKEYEVKAKKGTTAPAVEVKFVGTPTERAVTLRQPDSKLGLVVENRVLTAPGAPPKHHIEFQLPEDMSYQAGDYLAVLPSNPPEYVRRVLARFKVSPEQEIVLNVTGPTTLPAGKQVSISELLSGFVEIGQIATQRNITTVLEYAKNPSTRADLESMISNYKEGQSHSISMLDLLEKYPEIELPLGEFIASLPSMRLRQYSISSSPLWNPSHVTLTIGVIQQGQFLGVASNYLANLRKGDRVQLAVRPSAKAFHPPADPNIPMVLFAAGSGLAPFRGFLQERAAQAQAGRQVAKSVLFFGCRKPDEDYLYSDKELKEWSELGVVDVHPAFSRAESESGGYKYVQDRIWGDRVVVRDFYNRGAKFYTCGGNHIANAIRDASIRIIAEGKEGEQDQIMEIWNKIQTERYATDVFG
ncbi:cytochrome P450 [Ceratobasidium sp. AG-I]|nr:cytochrome P450 [Ceratobasidium sp. AG-I]